MLFAAELLVTATFLDVFALSLANRPAVFWLWLLPYNLAIKAAFVALLLVKSRRANVVLLTLLLLLFTLPYWDGGAVSEMIEHHWGYSRPA